MAQLRRNSWMIAVFSLIMTAILLSSLVPHANVDAAPAAAITPVSYSGSGAISEKVSFFNGNIDGDTRVCFDLSNFNKIDLQYAIDQRTVNTTTLYLQWSNNYVPSAATGDYEATATVVSANAADAHGGNQYLLAGQWNCIFADTANTNTLGLKVLGVAKP